MVSVDDTLSVVVVVVVGVPFSVVVVLSLHTLVVTGVVTVVVVTGVVVVVVNVNGVVPVVCVFCTTFKTLGVCAPLELDCATVTAVVPYAKLVAIVDVPLLVVVVTESVVD